MPKPNELLADTVWRFGKRVSTALARLRKGETLHCMSDAEDGTRWWFEPSRRTVGPVTASRVITLPEVQPCGDGLFEGMSQSYRYVAIK